MISCPHCKAEIVNDKATYCPTCGRLFSHSTGNADPIERPDMDGAAPFQKNVMNRYWDAYVVARATVGIGSVVKVGAVAVAVILALLGFIAANQMNNSAAMIGGVLLGVVLGIPIYVLGILVSAQGETLKATLDSAVYSSTFLNDEQRAKVMSL